MEVNGEKACIKCHINTDEPLRTCESGIAKIEEYANKLEDSRIKETLKNSTIVYIHPSCQKSLGNIIRKRKNAAKVEKDTVKSKKPKTRQSLDQFDWNKQCFFCGRKCQIDEKHPDRVAYKVTLVYYRETILEICDTRSDEWAAEVRARVVPCIDLVQANAKYHDSCRKNFTGKAKPGTTQGRPPNPTKQNNFDALCIWLEGEAESYSIAEVHDKMKELSGTDDDENVYSRFYLKVKLKEKYGESLFFVELNGRSDVIMFQNAVSDLINDKWYQSRLQNTDDEAKRIIKQAAKIILGELKSTTYDVSQYPSHEMIQDVEFGKSWVPSYLRLFIEMLIKNDLKRASIGQALVSATKPRSCIAPILFGLGVDVEKVFGSRWLLTELSRLGFSVSYDEVTRFKRNVVKNESITTYIKQNMIGRFGQWSSDNSDHDYCTLDGKGTLHGMGVILSVTPATNSVGLEPIPRNQISAAEAADSTSGIPILPYQPPEETGLSSVKLKPIMELNMANVLPENLIYDDIWHTLSFHPMLRPSWSGYMSSVASGSYPGQSSVSLLPIIDLNPNDMSCVYSTLKFVEKQAETLGIITPIITFDQPLWIKAFEVIKAKSLNMVCMLGGFHLLMSFMGSIGSLMKKSGLEESMEQIYAKNTVPHIISGKAISRALRAHFIVESALVSKLMSPLVSTENAEVEIEELKSDLDLIVDGCNDDSDFKIDTSKYPTLTRLLQLLDVYKNDLSQSSRTAKLWLQYLEYMKVVKDFIRSERTGNWSLYLFSISRMINLFAATAHIHYAKSARLHLQNMLNLNQSHPWVYEKFCNGFHTIRRSDKFWAGLWADLVIEQVMMRSIKSNGGLTRGRGIAESTRQLWLGSIHRSADIHNAMTKLTGACRKTSEQHVQLTYSRMKRDTKDCLIVKDWFDCHEPFDINEPNLKSLSTGITAKEDINCDDAETIGKAIQKKLDGVMFENLTIKRKDRAKTFEDMLPSVQIGNTKLVIDPTILFSRLTALVNFDKNIGDNFQYELTPEPTSLFKLGMMRKPAKSTLRNHFIKKENVSIVKSHDVCVIDGGALLHKVVWPSTTYGDVIEEYSNFVKRNFKVYSSVVVVFDGYEDTMSIKSQEHDRRSEKTSATVTISNDAKVTSNKELFLSNPANKNQLIRMLSSKFENEGTLTLQSQGDADVMIVETAVRYAKKGNEVVVSSDDTDVLILLMYHWTNQMAEVYFSTAKIGDQKKKVKSKPLYWKISSISSAYDHCDILLFAHAWCGCDTTSAIHNKGKTKILTTLKSEHVRELAKCFGRLDIEQETIGNAGIEIMLKSYGGKPTDTLTKLRHKKYVEMVSTANSIQPENLPPTERATFFHASRVHLQVAQWKQLSLDCLNPLEWGWKKTESLMIEPIKTDQKAAPEWLLKVIRCNCKSTSSKQCMTKVCSCQQNGLKCVKACGDCHGEGCGNSEEPPLLLTDSEDNENEVDERNIFDVLESFT